MSWLTIEDWSRSIINVSKQRGYELARQLPPDVCIQVGRQKRIINDRFDRLIESGFRFAEKRTEKSEAASTNGEKNAAKVKRRK